MDTISGDQQIHKTSLDGVYTLLQPEEKRPVIFDSPHSGQQLPNDFDYACDPDDLMRAEDRYVDELFADAPTLGASLLMAEFPRTYIDLNRRIDDIDPETYIGNWPVGEDGYVTPDPSNRSFAGIGLIRRLIRLGTPVYATKLSPAVIQSRINNYYMPYYAALEKMIDDLHYQFGQVWHINCHSMPSYSVRGNKADRADPSKPIDFVLGNRDGTTCDPTFTS
ncbi:MAG: N-formylglutamate amidohydrolase, partial [Pseudomonadota bacterium]